MTAFPCADILDETARDLDGGARLASFYVVEHEGAVEYLWNGGNARRAHAALARAFAAWGVDAADVPGMGVMVKKETTMTSEKMREMAEAAAMEAHPTARDVDAYEDAPGRWQVSVFDPDEHEGEWIYSAEIVDGKIELGMVS